MIRMLHPASALRPAEECLLHNWCSRSRTNCSQGRGVFTVLRSHGVCRSAAPPRWHMVMPHRVSEDEGLNVGQQSTAQHGPLSLLQQMVLNALPCHTFP